MNLCNYWHDRTPTLQTKLSYHIQSIDRKKSLLDSKWMPVKCASGRSIYYFKNMLIKIPPFQLLLRNMLRVHYLHDTGNVLLLDLVKYK